MRINYWHPFHEGEFYHIYNKTVGNEPLFPKPNNPDYFLQKWKEYFAPYLGTYAYCLMGNHFHFLAYVKKIDDNLLSSVEKEPTVAAKNLLQKKISYNTFLTDQLKRFLTCYTASINVQENRDGALFKAKTRRIQLISLNKVVDKICYIHHNPIHHQFSSRYENWKYSSYDTYLSHKWTLVMRQEGLDLFDKIAGYKNSFVSYHQKYKENWKRQDISDDDME
jgi:putative transposase